MPELITNTPEAWFRSRQRDLYLISFSLAGLTSGLKPKKKTQREIKKLQDWFAAHLPDTSVTRMGPSEYSGWLAGGPSYLAVDFDEAGLALFCAAWESAEGKSLSPYWQCELWPYALWRDQLSRFSVLESALNSRHIVRWWDTPQGVLMVGLDNGKEQTQPAQENNAWLSPEDGWWLLCQHYPALSSYSDHTFPYGHLKPAVARDQKQRAVLVVDYWVDGWPQTREYIQDPANIARLRQALSVPESMPLEIVEGDF